MPVKEVGLRLWFILLKSGVSLCLSWSGIVLYFLGAMYAGVFTILNVGQVNCRKETPCTFPFSIYFEFGCFSLRLKPILLQIGANSTGRRLGMDAPVIDECTAGPT